MNCKRLPTHTQRKGEISGLPLDSKARFLENMSDVARDKGLWKTALKIDQARSFHDPKRCKNFTDVIVTDASHPYVIGTRLATRHLHSHRSTNRTHPRNRRKS